MKIVDLLNVHGGLVSMAGGRNLPNKLGKYTYGVVKNIRKLEADILKPFQEARQKLVLEYMGAQPEKLTDEERQEAERKFDAVLQGLLDEESDCKLHMMDVGVLELCTVAEANAILPVVKEEA